MSAADAPRAVRVHRHVSVVIVRHDDLRVISKVGRYAAIQSDDPVPDMGCWISLMPFLGQVDDGAVSDSRRHRIQAELTHFPLGIGCRAVVRRAKVAEASVREDAYLRGRSRRVTQEPGRIYETRRELRPSCDPPVDEPLWCVEGCSATSHDAAPIAILDPALAACRRRVHHAHVVAQLMRTHRDRVALDPRLVALGDVD